MKDYRSHLTKKQRDALFKAFCDDALACTKPGSPHQKGAAQRAGVQQNTANAYYAFFRSIIHEHQRKLTQFKGHVEIDHHEFNTRKRRRFKMVNKKPVLIPDHKVLVFGILQRGDGPQEHKVFVQIVGRADKRLTIPIVRYVVDKGTVLYADMWRAFDELSLEYTFKRVNHRRKQFARKEGNLMIHTSTVDQFWKFCEVRLARFNGLSKTTVHLHISECAFRYNHKKDFTKALRSLVDAL